MPVGQVQLKPLGFGDRRHRWLQPPFSVAHGVDTGWGGGSQREGPWQREQAGRIRSRVQLGLMASSCTLEKDGPFLFSSVGKLL